MKLYCFLLQIWQAYLCLKKYCHFALQSADDSDDKNLRIVAAATKVETSATDRNQYKVQFNVDTVKEGFNATLMDFLGELNIGKLPSILVWYGLLPYVFINILFIVGLKLINT